MIIFSAFFFLLLLFILWLLLICPADTTSEQTKPFLGRAFAAGGLQSASDHIPENSVSAFRRALSCGYGISLDVRLSGDGEAIVFRDETLQRMCGVDSETEDSELSRLRELRLEDTDETLPLFSDILKLIAGQVPLIIVLHHTRNDRLLIEKVLSLLADYDGVCCFGAFDPNILRLIRHRAPKLLRAQFAGGEDEPSGGFRRFLRRHLLCNGFSRPHFIVCRHEQLRELSCRAAIRMLHAVPIVWTVTDQDDYYALYDSGIDIQIFQGFLPPALLTETDEPEAEESSAADEDIKD